MYAWTRPQFYREPHQSSQLCAKTKVINRGVKCDIIKDEDVFKIVFKLLLPLQKLMCAEGQTDNAPLFFR